MQQQSRHNCFLPRLRASHLSPMKVKQYEQQTSCLSLSPSSGPTYKRRKFWGLHLRNGDVTVSFPTAELLGPHKHSHPVLLLLDRGTLCNLMVKESHRLLDSTSDPKPPKRMWFLQQAPEMNVRAWGDRVVSTATRGNAVLEQEGGGKFFSTFKRTRCMLVFQIQTPRKHSLRSYQPPAPSHTNSCVE